MLVLRPYIASKACRRAPRAAYRLPGTLLTFSAKSPAVAPSVQTPPATQQRAPVLKPAWSQAKVSDVPVVVSGKKQA